MDVALTAETMHALGSAENAARSTTIAWEAYGEAASHLTDSLVDSGLRKNLIKRLNEIRTTLEALPNPEKT